MRISTSYISQQSLSTMLQQQTDLAKTQLQISTGERIVSPSDDPVGAVKILDIERQINLSQQYLDNADTAENKLTTTDGSLESAVNIIQRIRELGVQALNDTNSASARVAIATEISELNNELLGLANTTDSNGEYIFAGYQSDTKPFTSLTSGYIPTSPGPGDGQRSIRVGDGYSVTVNEPGNTVFVVSHDINTSQSIFETINDFVSDLNANTVGTASANGAILDNLDNGLNAIMDARTRIGTRLSAIDQQRKINENVGFSMKTTLSQVKDLDYAEAISKLNLQTAGLQAAQQAYVKVQGLSLFNYL